MKIGSLFDGSGTAPLAATMCGVDVAWISEIEPYPCRVTAARFPGVPNHGDITKMDGGKIEPVDVIVGGSPCQDLSVAGARKGLAAGTRSHLFYDMIRIIDEMREATNGAYPRYVIWENVPGAFSSSNGEDFRAVIKNFCKIADPTVTIPRPDRGGWKSAGAVVGNGYSLAWRALDAQYWGIPQRRKRIYLVVDLGGQRAGEILFKREGLRRNFAASGETRKGTAPDAQRGVGGGCAYGIDAAVTTGGNCTAQGPCYYDNICPTLKACRAHAVCYAIKGNYIDRDTKQNGGGWREGEMYTLDATDRHGVCVLNDQGGQVMSVSDKAGCLRAQEHGHQSVVCYDARGNGDGRISPTMTGDHSGHVSDYTTLITVRCLSMGEYVMDEKSSTLKARDYKGGTVDLITATKDRKYIVRRLTPLECCRLQGFPDWWENGVEGSDTARYRMWGNGMAVSNMLYVLQGVVG